jgi:hypothetical protein
MEVMVEFSFALMVKKKSLDYVCEIWQEDSSQGL